MDTERTTPSAPAGAPSLPGIATKSTCPDYVLQAIYGPASPIKAEDYDKSLDRWWSQYGERKMSKKEEEYTASSMLYDKVHSPSFKKH